MANTALTQLDTCTAQIRTRACEDCHLSDVFDNLNAAVGQLQWEFGDGVDNLIVA